MRIKILYLILTCLLVAVYGNGQIQINGLVVEKQTRIPLADVSILVPDHNLSFTTTDSGLFNFTLEGDYPVLLQFLFPGHLTVEAEIKSIDEDFIEIELENLSTELEGVVVRPKKVRYRNKNNPAVELIRQVIKHKPENRKAIAAPYAQVKSYEKMRVGATNLPKVLTKNPLLKPFLFVFENYDTSIYPGDKTFLMYLDETWNDVYIRKQPAYIKKIVQQRKYMSFDPHFINEGKVSENLNYLSQDIDIYDNNIDLVTNPFKSPLADAGPTFYKYFIIDTTIINDKRYVNMYFVPRNKADMLLKGNLTIALDENYAVKAAYMEIDKETNINFVQSLSVDLKFEPNQEGKYYLKESTNDAQFYPFIKGKRKMTATRTVVYDDFKNQNELADSIFTDPPIEKKEDYERLSDEKYTQMRPIPFTPIEAKTYENLDSLKRMRYYRNFVDWMSALGTGYKNIGLLEIGNIYNVYSFNPAEGNRIKMGLRTNPGKAIRYFASGHLAYGTRDQRLKHFAGLTWSIPQQPIYNYPMHYFRISSQYDVKVPGRIFDTYVQDNITENIQRGENNKFIYTYTAFASYNREFPHNLFLSLEGTYYNQEPGGSLYFIQNNPLGYTDTLKSITANQLGVKLKWSPGEKYYNDRTQRSTITSRAPVFILGADFGFKDFLGGDYSYQRYQFEFFKVWYLGALGMMNTRVKANYVQGNLPYPLLNIPKANQTYTYSTISYNLMNNGEFVSDRQVELLVNYNMYGFILNKIPLIKKLRLREMAGFKLIYGDLSDVNNPLLNSQTMRFPTDSKGNSYIYHLNKNEPYMEWNVGIGNIFKLIRVDYVRRISYLDHPNVSKHRIQFAIVFDF